MDKTIEERAKFILSHYTKQPTAIDLYSKDEVKEMLTQIAIEQKDIDESDLQTAKQTYFDAGYETAKNKMIDKACDWLYKNADSYDRGNGYHLDELLEDFEKAMEK